MEAVRFASDILFHFVGGAVIDAPIGEATKRSAACAADTNENMFYITVLPAEKANPSVVVSFLADGTTDRPGGAVLPDLVAVQQEFFRFAIGADDLQPGFIQIGPDGDGVTTAFAANYRLCFQSGNPGKCCKIFPDVIGLIAGPEFLCFVDQSGLLLRNQATP